MVFGLPIDTIELATKPNLLKSINQLKSTEPNLGTKQNLLNQIYQIKSLILNLQNWIYQAKCLKCKEPHTLDQIKYTEQNEI